MSANVCPICSKPILAGHRVNRHHKVYRSRGGSDDAANLAEVHQACHVRLHSERKDFARWGSAGGNKSSLGMHWLWTLKNVKDCPSLDAARAIVRMYST